MPESVVKATALLDTTQLQEGSQETVEALKSIGTQSTITSDTMKSKGQAMAEAAKSAASVVTAADSEIAKASKVATDAKRELAAAARDVKNGVGDASDAITLYALALKNSREATAQLAAAQKQLASAEEEVAAASHGTVSSVQATSAAIRGLEGNGGIRAVENFIAKTLGLGPAMQAIFPLVGGFMFAEMLFRVGEKIGELHQKAIGAGAAISAAFGEMHDKLQLTNDDLQVTDDKLRDQIAKLSGHPGNGLQTALDEAIARADKLLISLRADQKEIQSIFKENAVSNLGSLFSLQNTATTGKQVEEITADGKRFESAVRTANKDYAAALAADKTPEAQKAAGERYAQVIRETFEQRISAYQTEAQRLRNVEELSRRPGFGHNAIDNSAKIANVEGVADELQSRLSEFSIGQNIASDQATVGGLKGGKEGASKAAEDQMRGMEEANAKLRLSLVDDHDAMVVENLNFWERMLAAAAQYPANLRTVQEKVIEGNRAYYAMLNSEASKAVEVQRNQQEEDKKEWAALAKLTEEVERQEDDLNRTGARWDSYNKAVGQGAEIAARINLQLDEQRIRAQEAVFAITPLAAAQQLASDHAKEHSARIAALVSDLAKLREEATKLKEGDKDFAGNALRQQETQNQITSEAGAGKVQGAQDLATIQNAVAKPYLTAFDSINDGWLKVQNDIIAGNKNIGRDFAKLGLSLVSEGARWIEEWLAKRAKTYILDVVLHHSAEAQKAAATAAANTANAASAASAAAATTAATSTTNVAASLSYAAVAAAAAAASVAAVPIVGPALAPGAAASTFATISGTYTPIAAFEQGTMRVPRTGIAVLHPDEAVLGSPSAHVLREALSGRGPGGGQQTQHFNMGGNTFNGSAREQHGMHEQHLRRMIFKLHREGKLKLSSGG